MNFLPLVWAGLRHRPVRSVFTALSIAVAFLLFGLLQGINAGFARAIADAHRELLLTNTRVRGGAPMPLASIGEIQRIGGVREVAPRAYFTGNARGADPRSYIAALATYPDLFFDQQPAAAVAPSALLAMRQIRNGMLLTAPILEQFGWKIGDTVPLESDIVKRDGSRTWTFQIVGTIGLPKSPTKAYFGVINYDYLNESRATDRDTAEMFYVRIADPTKAISTAAAIDRIFANSSHETRTRSAQERAQFQARQMGDVSFFTDAIVLAVIIALAFVTGNTLRQSLEERMAEFAVLKTLGFSDGKVVMLAYGEGLLLCVAPAALGLALAYLTAPLAREDIGTIVVSPGVIALGLTSAAALALLGTAFPANRLRRLSIVGALTEH